MEVDGEQETSVIREASAEIRGKGHVFYNPVQEFNRDLSICVLNTFIQDWFKAKDKELTVERGKKDENGVTILEALSATGLRSIRYAKELQGVKEIVANDLSSQAVEAIKANIEHNSVADIISPSEADAIHLMSTSSKKFTALDLDPYGCPSRFLDSAVRTVEDGGLLLITATDMAVLAGNTPETAFIKYGSVALKTRACHEQGLRILLRCIEQHANLYGRYITPLLSISVDFYVRVFVTINTSQHQCKISSSKQSMVYMCTGCDALTLQPLGILKPNPTEKNPKQVKFALPTGPPVSKSCEHCGHPHHIGGPIWSDPIHDQEFLDKLIATVTSDHFSYLTNQKRIYGMLSVIKEELPDVPLYYGIDKLCGILHLESIPAVKLKSALLHAGYRVSLSHCWKTSLKTDAPMSVIWDVFRCWAKIKPIKPIHLKDGTPVQAILSKESRKQYDLNKVHPDANPKSRQQALVRFPENPAAYWGPGTRSTIMVKETKILKELRKQDKHKKKREQLDKEKSPDPKIQKVEENF
ncbi:tRNA (guanine(26)-N(2))-dimethyltransferase [Culicoides brevitarsis]|uniref:tRNA (guanine(26)-N(2))-dimethyltransferase n=1 Tax=Culicoides brevitarsis TaxID=469753 RepID=UPI00307C5755